MAMTPEEFKPSYWAAFSMGNYMELKALTNDQIQSAVETSVREAVDYIESDIEPLRSQAQRYFMGEVDIGAEEGRSKVVATKCRDAVRALKPALMRTFMASDKPVEFIPVGPDDVDAAEQATSYAEFKFRQKNGYRILYDVFHDALIKKAGIAKVYYEEKEEAELDEYTGLSEEVFASLSADDELEILEWDESEDGSYSVKVQRKVFEGDICIESIAPEDFFVNSEATCIEDAAICGNRNADMLVGDLVAMGYDFEKVIDHAGTAEDAHQTQSDEDRTGGTVQSEEERSIDPSTRRVLVTEAYMKLDADGTGIPVLHWFLCIGTKYHILDKAVADQKPYAVFEIDPEPHTFFGRSLVDIIIPDQDASTSMLRGLLDNVALSNSPGAQVVDTKVNIEDLMNNEIGRIVRVKEQGAIAYDAVPFTAGQTLSAMQYHDETVENKTGVSRASMGLDPDTLQNATAAAVNATVSAAQAQPELMARNLAEGGMRQLFRLLLVLSRQHADEETMMRLNGKFIQVDPRSWNAKMDLATNVGLGTGGEIEREKVLRETLQSQMTIFAQGGPTNGMVTMTHIRNTLADILKMGGIQNADRYYTPMSDGLEKVLLQLAQKAMQTQAQPNPLVMAEQIKAQQKTQTDMAKLALEKEKAVAEYGLKVQQAASADDLSRDKMIQELITEAARIYGQYQTQVDVTGVQAAQAAPRQV